MNKNIGADLTAELKVKFYLVFIYINVPILY